MAAKKGGVRNGNGLKAAVYHYCRRAHVELSLVGDIVSSRDTSCLTLYAIILLHLSLNVFKRKLKRHIYIG